MEQVLIEQICKSNGQTELVSMEYAVKKLFAHYNLTNYEIKMMLEEGKLMWSPFYYYQLHSAVIVADYFQSNRGQYMRWSYPDGTEGDVTGELYYNKELERYEHDVTKVIDDKEIQFLIVSK